jgi:Arc/MetJ-type ribon-helix-helix transcriptional regulator
MSLRKNISISLSPKLHAVAERTLASSRYGNFSENVRAGLGLLDERKIESQAWRDMQDTSWQTPVASPMAYPHVGRSSQEMLLVADHAIGLGSR